MHIFGIIIDRRDEMKNKYILKNEINGDKYNKFIEYISEKCHAFSFYQYGCPKKINENKKYDLLLSEVDEENFDVINCDVDFENFKRKYNLKKIINIKKGFKNVLERKEKINENIEGCLEWKIYKYRCQILEKELEGSLLKKEIVNDDLNNSEGHIKRYYIINDSSIKFLQKVNSIYDWCFPYYFENLTFYSDLKNEEIKIFTISHEELTIFYYEDEEELEMIKFLEKEENV